MCFRLLSHTGMIQVNLDVTDSMRPGKFVRHMHNQSYTYDTYLICMGLGPGISSVIDESPSYSGPSYPSSPAIVPTCIQDHQVMIVSNLGKLHSLYKQSEKKVFP